MEIPRIPRSLNPTRSNTALHFKEFPFEIPATPAVDCSCPTLLSHICKYSIDVFDSFCFLQKATPILANLPRATVSGDLASVKVGVLSSEFLRPIIRDERFSLFTPRRLH